LRWLWTRHRIRRGAKVNRRDRIEEEVAVAYAFAKYDEPASPFFLRLQDTVFVGIGEKRDVIRRYNNIMLSSCLIWVRFPTRIRYRAAKSTGLLGRVHGGWQIGQAELLHFNRP
jgi:hypothetical protein